MNKEQQLQAYIDEWADIVYDHFGMGESNEYSLRKAWLAGHAAAVEEYKELNGWIPVTERQPEIGRKVPFICMSRDEFYNGQQMWGTYQGFKFREHEFTTPGIGWSGSHWLDLDFPPSPEKEQQ